ncbi:hypothetical protein [Microseira sp. BLCC-F43]|uniref:hypothetical protein n=1 Tax=Microseira sp. BLCC-F43 TaxID=3153602 RepID=UPI0035B934E0
MAPQNRLAEVNAELKAANIGVQVRQKGNRLCLRATLPPKPGSEDKKPYDLRHAWAVRTLEYGLDLTRAAQQIRNQYPWYRWKPTPISTSTGRCFPCWGLSLKPIISNTKTTVDACHRVLREFVGIVPVSIEPLPGLLTRGFRLE